MNSRVVIIAQGIQIYPEVSVSIAVAVPNSKLHELKNLPFLNDYDDVRAGLNLLEELEKSGVEMQVRFLVENRDPAFIGSACRDLINEFKEATQYLIMADSSEREDLQIALNREDMNQFQPKTKIVDSVDECASLIRRLGILITQVTATLHNKGQFEGLMESFFGVCSRVMLRPIAHGVNDEPQKKRVIDTQEKIWKWAKEYRKDLKHDGYLVKNYGSKLY
ncbi:MAG: hypothetical protein CMO81_03225 [Waddliaceae bacterium]|nr:hypothetical protein [Waddliaceae bacterium]